MTDHAQLAIDHVSDVLDLPEARASARVGWPGFGAVSDTQGGGTAHLAWLDRSDAARAAAMALVAVQRFDESADRAHHPGPLSAPRTESTAAALASPPPAEEASTDYASARAFLVPEYSHRGVVFPEQYAMAAGEYASEGEPDLVIEVVHAVDREGVEVSDHVSATLARYIASAEFAAAVDEARRTLRRADVLEGVVDRDGGGRIVVDVPEQEG